LLALFPDQTLLDRPKLIQSTTFLVWMRLTYPHFKSELMKALQQLKTILAADDIVGVEYDKCNTNRTRYVHMLNLYSIFVLHPSDSRLSCSLEIKELGGVPLLLSQVWLLFFY